MFISKKNVESLILKHIESLKEKIEQDRVELEWKLAQLESPYKDGIPVFYLDENFEILRGIVDFSSEHYVSSLVTGYFEKHKKPSKGEVPIVNDFVSIFSETPNLVDEAHVFESEREAEKYLQDKFCTKKKKS